MMILKRMVEKKSAFVYLANLLMNHIFFKIYNEGMVISKEINDITIIFKDYWMYWWLKILRKVIKLILNFILNLKYYFSKPIKCVMYNRKIAVKGNIMSF